MIDEYCRFVLNNNGYTVERLIHGKTASYNELPLWDYNALSRVFGPAHPSKYHGPIRTSQQLEKLLSDEAFNQAETFQVAFVPFRRMFVQRTDTVLVVAC